MLNLNDRKWRPFFLTELFSTIQRGKRLKADDHISGNMPYVSSSALWNGIDDFVSNTEKVRIFSKCISLANSGSVGSAFYEPFSFVASDHITHLKNDKFNKYHYLFIASILNRLSQKYNFNREINDNRISREKIMLPTNENNDLDLDFMEQYIKERESLLLYKYKEFINKTNSSYNPPQAKRLLTLESAKWNKFYLEDIFNIYTGTDLIMNKIEKGNIPVISHSAINNGVACRTKKIEKRKLFSFQNTISLADRGNFKAFVQTENFYIGTRVKALEAKNKIPYHSLFFIANQINKQSVRFSYGHNACDHVGRISILLPENKQGSPDYNFMKQYIIHIRLKKYQQYLEYIDMSKPL